MKDDNAVLGMRHKGGCGRGIVITHCDPSSLRSRIRRFMVGKGIMTAYDITSYMGAVTHAQKRAVACALSDLAVRKELIRVAHGAYRLRGEV